MPGMAPALPPAGNQFDGSYLGQDSLISGVAFQCGEPVLAETVAINGGRFDYPFQVSPPRTAPLPVQVAADGTLFGQMQYGLLEETPWHPRQINDWVTLRGRISGTQLDATITTMRCARHLVAQRQ